MAHLFKPRRRCVPSFGSLALASVRHAPAIYRNNVALTRVGIPYEQIKGLQIAGEGKIVESVDNAFIGGGFGVGGALKGAAQAMLLNAAVSALTRNERFECELTLEWETGELVMMNREYLPEVIGQVLHPFIERIPS